ncbi:hypothetical protein V6R94_08200 [Pediococcus acidilactici]
MTAAVKNPAVTKQPAVIERFQQMIDNRHLAHAYLLTGASGTGKKRWPGGLPSGYFVKTYKTGCPVENVKNVIELVLGSIPT